VVAHRDHATLFAVSPTRPTTVIFDLGAVLIDWNPRYLYRSLIDDPDEMERFLAEVTTPAWNHEQDRGRRWADAVAELVERHPHHAELIRAYHARWPEMLGEPIHETVDILAELRDAGVALYALTNWSAETWPIALERYPFLGWFRGIVVSGLVGAAKPEAAVFEALVERYGVTPADAVFIDDQPANVDAAVRLGFRGIRFTDATMLRQDLAALGLLDAMSNRSVSA
jgi:2-haloacid dehalogenase